MKRLLLLLSLTLRMMAAPVTISDVIRYPDHSLASGSATISWPSFTTAAGGAVAGGSLQVSISAGVLSVALEPNDTAVPTGTSYAVSFRLGRGSYSQRWVVTTSVSALTIADVVTSTIPTPGLTIALAQLSGSGCVKGGILAYGTSWGCLAAGTDTYVLTADSTQTRGVKWSVAATGGGSGTITGPVSSSLNAVALWNSTAGDVLKNSTLLYDGTTLSGAPTINTGDGTVAGGQAQLELSANGTDYRGWMAPDSLAVPLWFVHANAVPTAGQVMSFGAPTGSPSKSTYSWVSLPANTTATTSQWFTAYNSSTGAYTKAQPAFTDISGAATSAQLPNPGASSKGGVNSKTCTSGDFVSTVGTDGSITCTTPSGGGSSTLSYATAYNDTTVGTSDTTICSLDIPGNTLLAGGAANSHGVTITWMGKNITGNHDITWKIKFGSDSVSMFSGGVGGGGRVYGTWVLANNLGVTNAQAMIFMGGDAGITAGVTAWEPSQDTTATKTLSITAATDSGTDLVRIYGCKFQL